MSKRTRVTQPKKDIWDTPPEAAKPLIEQLSEDGVRSFAEPCAGSYALAEALCSAGLECLAAADIQPRDCRVRKRDATDPWWKDHLPPDTPIVTNPPYSRMAFAPMMYAWLEWGVWGWLLVPLDWIANLWTQPLMERVDRIVPVGRVSWLRNNKSGLENSTWIRFRKHRQGLIVARRKCSRSADC